MQRERKNLALPHVQPAPVSTMQKMFGLAPSVPEPKENSMVDKAESKRNQERRLGVTGQHIHKGKGTQACGAARPSLRGRGRWPWQEVARKLASKSSNISLEFILCSGVSHEGLGKGCSFSLVQVIVGEVRSPLLLPGLRGSNKVRVSVRAIMAKVAVVPGLSKEAEGTKRCKAIPCRGLDFGHVVVGADENISLPSLMVF